jgi:hypothetical protein
VMGVQKVGVGRRSREQEEKGKEEGGGFGS